MPAPLVVVGLVSFATSVLLPLLISLVAIIIDNLTGNAISSAILNIAFAPIVLMIESVLPDINIADIVSLIPSDILQYCDYLGISSAVNFVTSSAVNIFTAVTVAVLHMHFQAFLISRVPKGESIAS